MCMCRAFGTQSIGDKKVMGNITCNRFPALSPTLWIPRYNTSCEQRTHMHAHVIRLKSSYMCHKEAFTNVSAVSTIKWATLFKYPNPIPCIKYVTVGINSFIDGLFLTEVGTMAQVYSTYQAILPQPNPIDAWPFKF